MFKQPFLKTKKKTKTQISIYCNYKVIKRIEARKRCKNTEIVKAMATLA